MASAIIAPTPMPRWRIWFLAVRPWSLTISVIPILLASALAALLLVPALLKAVRYMAESSPGQLTSATVGMSTKLHQIYGVIAIFALIILGMVER